MGTGKTRIGKLCAKRLGYSFFDSDTQIEKRTGRKVAVIFQEDGESTFRTLEQQILAELAQGGQQVISTGGGAALFERNVEVLRRTGTIALLKASPEVLLTRVGGKNAAKRPLLASAPDPLARIREMLAAREPYYRDAADFSVFSENQRPGDVAERVIARYREF